MKQFGFSKIFNSKFVLILSVYLLSGTILIKYYQYQISPDSISYISIAQKYLHGDFNNAINGIWSPLYSWLLVPLLYFEIEPLLASVILTVIVGLFILISAKLFITRFDLSEGLSHAVLLSLIPVILSFAFSGSPPDFFIVLFLILYFNAIYDNNYAISQFKGLLCGVLGSLAYFSKAYALPFFLIHFTILNVIHYYANVNKVKKKSIVANFAIGLLVFAVLSGVWITLISIKYEKITYSTAARFNYLAAGPESKSKGGPYFYKGFFAPTNSTAVSAWEDPTYHKMVSWSPFESWDLFKHQLKLISHNTKKTIIIFSSFSSLSQLILIFYFLLAILPIKKLIIKYSILFPLISMLVYCAGYSLIVVERRYLWINCFLLIFMGGYLLDMLLHNGYFTKIKKVLLIVLFAATFIVPPVKFLKSNLNTKKDVYLLSNKLQNEFNIAGNIASNKHHTTLYIAYHIGAKYFGQIKNNLSESDFQNELTRYDIDYIFLWGEANKYLNYLNQYKKISLDDISDLKIYCLKQRI